MNYTMFILPYNYTPCNSTWTCLLEVEDEEEIKIYDDGKLHHLKRFEANITEAVYAEDETEQSDILRVNVTLNFRLLRTSYVWQNFFSMQLCAHALSMQRQQKLAP